MRRIFFLKVIFMMVLYSASSQDTTWTLSSKQDLLDNFVRTQNEINEETRNLTSAQWNFKESTNSWSIAEVLEHLNMWQLITQDHIRFMLYNGRQPDLVKYSLSDSVATSFIYEEKSHVSPDLTIPTGKIPGNSNLGLFNSYCNRIVENIKSSDINFRLYYRKFTDGYMTNMYQAYVIQYGHVDRHLRQIRRIKANLKFPK